MLKLYANRDIRRLLPVDVRCGAFSVQASKPTSVGLDALPDLDVAACTNETQTVVTVFIVNRSLQEVKAVLNMPAFETSEETRLYEITADRFDDINSVFDPAHIVCTTRAVAADEWRRGYTLRPTSIYALEVMAPLGAGGKAWPRESLPV
ncbi:hypothetical protein [Cohnella nanjingensis]|uniref:hypothetical protein n=1 Tax=Cohnella nanjingensis TaxID=1387779 RepID=UPI0028B10FA7|nr:hypothetical protein [Cohnella nanjingensis]